MRRFSWLVAVLLFYALFPAAVYAQAGDNQEGLYDAITDFRAGKFDGAKDKFTVIINTAKDKEVLSEAWKYLAKIYQVKKDYAKALEAYSNIFAIDSANASAYGGLFELYKNTSDKKFLTELAGRITASPGCPTREMAEAFSRAKLRKAAGYCYRRLIENKKNNSYLDGALWAFPLEANYNAGILTADVNADKIMEIIGVSENMFCINSSDGSIIWEYPLDGYVRMTPLIADFDGDLLPDVAVISGDKIWVVRGYDGKTIWIKDGLTAKRETGYTVNSLTGDFNGDGIKDILFDNEEQETYCVDGAGGRNLWNKNGNITWNSREHVFNGFVADINADGIEDFVIWQDNNETPRQDAAMPGLRAIVAHLPPRLKGRAVVISDVNNDSNKETVFITNQGEAGALDVSGRELWRTRVYLGADNGSYHGESLFTANVDSDAQQEVILESTAEGGTIFIIDGKSGLTELAIKEWAYGGKLYDFDLDGAPELFCHSSSNIYGDRMVSAISLAPDKNTIWDFPYYSNNIIFTGDVNSDGKPEIVLQNGSLVYCARLQPFKTRERRRVR